MEPRRQHDFAESISREDINKLPLRRYSGAVHVVDNASDVGSVLRRLKGETLLGFDTETRPAFTKGRSNPPALVQLAASDVVYLFQLKRTKLPKGLRRIFSDPGILKVGVGLDYDLRKLKELAEFEPAGLVELGAITDNLGIQNNGLRGLTAILLGFRISKRARLSNWNNDRLSQAQITYAATDAWVSREMYVRLLEGNLIE